MNSGLLGSPGGAAILVLFSVAEGFGLFYSPFQFWPMIFFLANAGVRDKGINTGFSLLSRPLPAPEASFHNPVCKQESGAGEKAVGVPCATSAALTSPGVPE